MTTTLRATIISFVFLTFSPQLLAEETDYLGFGFGTGVSLTVDAFGGKDRVESASLVNGIVRVDEERNAQARVVLDLHYFFEQTNKFWNVDAANWGQGPFVAIQPGDNEIVNAIGFGWMIGFRRSDDPGKESQSWNFGIGYLVDPNARVLGDGLEKDQPLPAGESEVRYKTEGESSLMLIFSFSFK
jgi:hypothetical protein